MPTTYNYGAIHHDDGTITFTCMSETVGFIHIPHLSHTEMRTLAADLGATTGDDFDATLIRWANGYRPTNM